VVAPAALKPAHLTQEEAQLVYNIEVLGLPLKRAAELAGIGLATAYQPHIVQARDLMRKEVQERVRLTKEDVVFGVHDAIGRARILAEPSTEIRGWEVISKLLGYDAPSKVEIDVHHTESVAAVRDHVRSLPDAELLRLADASNIVDGDFQVVGK
jgi:hypothetical protein